MAKQITKSFALNLLLMVSQSILDKELLKKLSEPSACNHSCLGSELAGHIFDLPVS